MNPNTEIGRCIVLRLRILEARLTRNVAKFGSMSPFVEATWSEETWKTKAAAGAHLFPSWNEGHIFECQEPAPLQLKIRHNGLLFTHQEIGSCLLSAEDLAQGRSLDWIDILHEGLPAGKLLLSVNMYEERRSEQSTHNTSYASADLKEEYSRKLNELELEKEELEFYKRKYKRKAEKLNQEKRNYRAKVSDIVRRTTPKHTEESSSEEIGENQPAIVVIAPPDGNAQEEALLKREKVMLQKEKEGLVQLKDQIELDLARLRREKHKISARNKDVGYSHGKLSELARNLDESRMPKIVKSTSDDKIRMNSHKMSDWQEIEDIKAGLLRDTGIVTDLLELKMHMGNSLTSPRRATTPKSTDLGRGNVKLRGSNYSTGKLVLYD